MKFFTIIKKIINDFYPWSIFIFFTIFILLFTHSHIDSTNSASRFLTMESLVERNSFVLDEKSKFIDDKIFKDNDFYSSKPPVLSVAGAGIYYVLYNFFNLNLPEETNFLMPNIAIYIITLILIGGTYFLLLYYFYKTLNLLKIKKKYQTLLLLGLGAGTLYFTYSITLNNHTIAGSFLFISFYYLLKIKINNLNRKKYFALSGLLASLAAVIDLPTGLTFFVLFFIYILLKFSKKQSIYYILAAMPIFIIHLFFNYQITGDFLPAQFHPELWQWEGVEFWFSNNKQPLFSYIFNILIGTQGLFSYSPVLLFAGYSIYKIIKNKNHQFKFEAVLFIIGFLTIALFYIIKARIYTGSAFGFRWFIALTPLLYFFIIFLFTKKIFSKFLNVFMAVLLVSIIFSLIGFINPWPCPNILIKIQSFNYSLNCPLLSNLSSIIN